MRTYNFILIPFLICILFNNCSSKKEISKKNINTENTLNQQEVKNKESLIYYNKSLKTNIKTILCHKIEDELSLPIINLNSNEKILVSFDDLQANIKDYYYTIIHCNADWTRSDLMLTEYLFGFGEEPITNYEFSFNTIQKYTHYQFEFPTVDFKPLISGNYIFKIYEKGGETIAYRRFMVLETKLNIKANVKRSTHPEYRNSKHEIELLIQHPTLNVANPFSDIKIHIKQNNRDDNAITNITPLFVKNNELIYDYNENKFWGNNEFRHFDITSLRYQSDRIRKIELDSISNNVYLFHDIKRSFNLYSIEPDINGKYLIKSQEGWKSSIEADYTNVNFTIPMDYVSYGDLYIFGELSDWKINKNYKLNYNFSKKQYEGSVLLKQGYYNYHYVLNDTTTKRIDVSFIEGTHYQTRNDYFIYVYHRSIGDRYDSFVGFIKTSSKELF